MTLPFARLSFPELYEQELVGPLFRPFAEVLVEEAALAAGEHVLDVACGTGIVARLARQRVGAASKVVGVDVSPPMLAVAGRIAPDIEWREGDAAALPLQPDEQFDALLCHQGFQFFPDKAAAAAQFRRALTRGGRAVIGTWRPDDELPFLRELRRVAERHVGPITDRRHSFGEAGPLEAVLRDAGFGDVRSKTVSHTVRFQDGTTFLRLNAMAMVGMSAGGKDMSEEDRERVVADIVRDSAVVTGTSDQAALAYEISTNLTTGRG